MKKGKKLVPNFKIGDMVVYPSHGVGQIVSIETMEVWYTSRNMHHLQPPASTGICWDRAPLFWCKNIT